MCRTILGTPFVPFTVLFSHVLATQGRADLERLQLFATIMAASPTSKPAYKVSRLASVFVDVARIYVDLKEQEAAKVATAGGSPSVGAVGLYSDQQQSGQDVHLKRQQSEQNRPDLATESPNDYTRFDPFLDALGFADQSTSMIDATAVHTWDIGGTESIGNWFTGQQHIMGLLEDDLSYLDDPDLYTEF